MRDLGREELIEKLLRLRPELEKAGVTRLSLFGSRARRDNRPDSDIDLVVDLDDSRRLSLLDVIGYGHVVEDSIGFPTHVTTRGSLDGQFKERVERDEVVVFDQRG
jgi:hypothetical protein